MKNEACAYCSRRRKLFKCSMLSAHCAECCTNECGGPKKINHVNEALNMAREMGGASWPSADCTRMALINLAARIASHVGTTYRPGMKKRALTDSILDSCGLLNKREKASMADRIKDAEALIQ